MKKLLRRHKSVLIVLGIYWPFIFWLTHIPVPAVARHSGMSDKIMHVLAYFVLTFLLWYAISPYEKVNWNKTKVWYLLLTIVSYSLIDEYLQAFVGRSADGMDFVANLFGVIFGVALASVFGFWSALLTLAAVFIFVISNMSNLLIRYSQYHLNSGFHLAAYAIFTLIWIQHIERFSKVKTGCTNWLLYTIFLPLILLIMVKLTAPALGRPVWWADISTALFGICSAILISWGLFKVSRRP